jgi:phage terminase small subunit
MRRGTKPQPTVLLQLHGTKPHRPRAPDAEAPAEIGDPPAGLSEAEAALWHDAVSVAPLGVLKAADRAILRQWVSLQAQFEEANRQQEKLNERGGLPFLVKEKSGDLTISPYVYMMNKLRGQLIQMAQIMGYCPTGRVGLTARDERADAPDGEDNRWIKLERMRRSAANAS